MALVLALGKVACFPEWYPHFRSWTLRGGERVASGLLALPLPARLCITSLGKGNWDPRILSSVVPMLEPLFHEWGLGRRSFQLLATLTLNWAVATGSLEQDKKCPIWKGSHSTGNLGRKRTLCPWLQQSRVSTLLSWDGRGRIWVLVPIPQTHCSYWGLVDFLE